VKERLEMITEEVEGIVRPRGADEEEEEEVLSEEDDGEDFLLDTKSTPARLSSTGEKEGEEVNEKETIDGEEEEGQESLRRAETETQTEKEAEAEAEAGAPSTTSTSTLRHRHRHPQTSAITATSTPTTFTSTTTALPTIPSTTAAAAAATTQTKTQLTESTLTAHRLEQESLTESLVALASQLKASSQAFQSSLEAEKSILARAVDGLDRNVAGLEAAGKRMGVLRRMTEGKGWWGRMLIHTELYTGTPYAVTSSMVGILSPGDIVSSAQIQQTGRRSRNHDTDKGNTIAPAR
ncbi:hypothetical protein T310_7527, partial [Rasamsonia emersonii CBS 393.64]